MDNIFELFILIILSIVKVLSFIFFIAAILRQYDTVLSSFSRTRHQEEAATYRAANRNRVPSNSSLDNESQQTTTTRCTQTSSSSTSIKSPSRKVPPLHLKTNPSTTTEIQSTQNEDRDNDHKDSESDHGESSNPFNEYPLSFSPSLLKRVSLPQPKTNPNNSDTNNTIKPPIDKLHLLRSRIAQCLPIPSCLSSSSTASQTQSPPSNNNKDTLSSHSPLQTNNNNNNNNIQKSEEEEDITPRAQAPIPCTPPALPQLSLSPPPSLCLYNISDESSIIHHQKKDTIKHSPTQNDSLELPFPSSRSRSPCSFNDESGVHHLSRLELDTDIQEEDFTRHSITRNDSHERSLSVASSPSFPLSRPICPSPSISSSLSSNSDSEEEFIYIIRSETLIPPQETIDSTYPQNQPLQPIFTHLNRGVFHLQSFPAFIHPDWWMILVGNLIYLNRNRFYFVDHLIAGSTKSAIFTVYNENGVRMALKITGKQEFERFHALPTHHGIIKVYDWENSPESNHWAAFVMEHAECTLSDWVRFGKGTVDQKQKFVKAVLETVSFLHSKGFMCGDISPNNFVLVHNNGKKLLKMIDFEQAQRVVENLGHVVVSVCDIVFTPGYLAPELTEFIGSTTPFCMLTQQNDTFSVAAVAFFIFFAYTPALNIIENFKTGQRFDVHVRRFLTSGKTCNIELGEKIAQLLSYFPSRRPTLKSVVNSLSWIHVDK